MCSNTFRAPSCHVYGDAQSLAPDYAAVNGNPCRVDSHVHHALTAGPPSTTAPGAVVINESTTSAAPLSALLPRRAAATEATLGSSTDAERPPESASTEQSQIVNTFPSGLLPSGSPKAVAGIRALDGVLYGANGKPVVLQVSRLLKRPFLVPKLQNPHVLAR